MGGFSGTEASTAERDPSLYPTILSGDIGISGFAKDNSFHVVIALDEAVIDGFIIEDGNASENFTNDSRGVGGGLWSEGQFLRCVIASLEITGHIKAVPEPG